MTRRHRFDVWVIVRDGRAVTQYLSEREANRYVNLRNQNHGKRPFQSVMGSAEVEFDLPATDVDERRPK